MSINPAAHVVLLPRRIASSLAGFAVALTMVKLGAARSEAARTATRTAE
ncbi:MAG: hypothetical protein QOC66_1153 [Pseudonocardiales bacterium]|jgi:hypothetical protein|nr:hypothetical protein [Pseudonocardiales bacterium]